MKDVHLVKKVEEADSRIYCEIFNDVYEYHHEHQHVYNEDKKHVAELSGLYGGLDFHDVDPWTGSNSDIADHIRLYCTCCFVVLFFCSRHKLEYRFLSDFCQCHEPPT